MLGPGHIAAGRLSCLSDQEAPVSMHRWTGWEPLQMPQLLWSILYEHGKKHTNEVLTNAVQCCEQHLNDEATV